MRKTFIPFWNKKGTITNWYTYTNRGNDITPIYAMDRNGRWLLSAIRRLPFSGHETPPLHGFVFLNSVHRIKAWNPCKLTIAATLRHQGFGAMLWRSTGFQVCFVSLLAALAATKLHQALIRKAQGYLTLITILSIASYSLPMWRHLPFLPLQGS